LAGLFATPVPNSRGRKVRLALSQKLLIGKGCPEKADARPSILAKTRGEKVSCFEAVFQNQDSGAMIWRCF
jgi:hypothetical protein